MANIVPLRNGTDVPKIVHLIQKTLTAISGIVLDYDCVKGDVLIQLSSNSELFNTKNKWLIFEEIDDKNVSALLSQLAMTHLYVDAEISYMNIGMAFFNETTKYVIV